MRYEIRSSRAAKPIDSAVKKDGEWIGLFSGQSLKEIQKDYPDAKVVDTVQSRTKSRSR